MTVVRTVCGGFLATCLCAVSVACNYRFGTHLGSGVDGQIYGVLGAVADGLKALIPLAITAALASRQFGKALAGVVLFLIFSTYSLASALGLYSLSREAIVSDVDAGKAVYESAISEGNRIKARLKVLGAVRAVGAVDADISLNDQ